MDGRIRIHVMERLHAKDEEFGKLFHKINMANLAEAKKKRIRAQPLMLRIRKRRLTYP